MEETKQDEGFTLIEILVAILVLAMAVVGIMALIPTSYHGITSSGRFSTMNHLAQRKMDELRALGYDSNAMNDGIHPSTFLSESDPEIHTFGFVDNNTPTEIYDVSWIVSAGPATNSKNVIVTVGFDQYEWNGIAYVSKPSSHSTGDKTYTYQTYISQD